MYLTLQRYIAGKPYTLISAEDILNPLRGRKTPGEVARIRAAVALTDDIIDRITEYLRPGLTELEIANWIHETYRQEGVVPSWDPGHCPTVTAGPDSPIGHTSPSNDYVTKPGELVRIDQGVILNEYISTFSSCGTYQPVRRNNDTRSNSARLQLGARCNSGGRCGAQTWRAGLHGG